VHALAIDNRQLDVAIEWRSVDWHPLHIGTIKCKHLLYPLRSTLLNAEEDFAQHRPMVSRNNWRETQYFSSAVRDHDLKAISGKQPVRILQRWETSPDIHSTRLFL
jgi:hypothetical protein